MAASGRLHHECLPTFNLPHLHLVDTAPRGVSEINERGVVHEGVEYPLDVLIYATGFDSTVTQGVWGDRASVSANDEIPEWTPGGVVNLLEAVAPKRRDKPEIQAREAGLVEWFLRPEDKPSLRQCHCTSMYCGSTSSTICTATRSWASTLQLSGR
jgi:hypothetical protein